MTAADSYPLLADFASRPSGHVATLNAKRREARTALDEIERLRAEVAELRRHTNCCPYADSEWWCMCAEPHDGDCLYDDEPVAGR